MNKIWTDANDALIASDQQEGKNSYLQKMKGIEQTFGFSFADDVVAGFGNEIGWYLEDFSVENNLPVPQIVFFISMANHEKINAFFNKLNSFISLFIDDNYQGVPMKYAKAKLNNVIQPSICFLDNYLLVGINMDILKRAIDVHKNSQESLLNASVFSEVNKNLTGKNRGVQFYRVDQIALRLMPVLDWFEARMTKKEHAKTAFQSGVEKKINVVLEQILSQNNDLLEMNANLNTLNASLSQAIEGSQEEIDLQDNIRVLETAIREKKNEIQSLKDKKSEMEKIIENYKRSISKRSEERKLLLEEVGKPVLDFFDFIKAVGINTTSGDGVFEANVEFSLE